MFANACFRSFFSSPSLLLREFLWSIELAVCVYHYTSPANIYLFKVNNKSTKTICEICLTLTIKTLERRQWRRSGAFIFNSEQISLTLLVFQILAEYLLLDHQCMFFLELSFLSIYIRTLSTWILQCLMPPVGIVLTFVYVMHCTICYHSHNLKNLKNTHGGMLLLVKLQAKALKVTLFHGLLLRF